MKRAVLEPAALSWIPRLYLIERGVGRVRQGQADIFVVIRDGDPRPNWSVPSEASGEGSEGGSAA
jgi:hypothetical protein